MMPSVTAAPLLMLFLRVKVANLFLGIKVAKRKMGHRTAWEKQLNGGKKRKKEKKKEDEGLTNAVLVRVHIFQAKASFRPSE